MSMSARAFAVLGVVALEACAAGTQPAATLGARSNAELEATYRARADSALARYTAADTDFMTRMIGHHAQAVTMASLAPGRRRPWEASVRPARQVVVRVEVTEAPPVAPGLRLGQ
jgi:uncharacterized protein (DUF305 family)